MSSILAIILILLRVLVQSPNSNGKLRDVSAANTSPFFEYERVTKLNYSVAELTAMVELISCIKSIVRALRQIQAQLVPFLRRHVYNAMQIFVQHTMIPILHRADKRKIVCTKTLHDLRLLVRVFNADSVLKVIKWCCLVSAGIGSRVQLC